MGFVSIWDKVAGSGPIKFLDDLLDSQALEQGAVFEVTSVTESRSRSGYMLRTSGFMYYLYKSEDITEDLIKALEDLSCMTEGYALMARINYDSVKGFDLGIDDELPRLWVKQKKSRLLSVFTSQDHSVTETSSTKPGLQTEMAKARARRQR